jgi:hypothetical protein
MRVPLAISRLGKRLADGLAQPLRVVLFRAIVRGEPRQYETRRDRVREVVQLLAIQHRIAVREDSVDLQPAERFGVCQQNAKQVDRRVVVGLAGLRHEVQND